MTTAYGEAVDELILNITAQDFDTMLPYIMKMLAEGFKLIRIDENTFMIKYCGYSIISLKEKTIKAVVKKPD